MYAVKEIFFTLQGEGVHAGRPAVFCRFSGCNLWTGHEKDRDKAVCKFCDTDFVGLSPDGGKFATADELAARVAQVWGHPDTPAVIPSASKDPQPARRTLREGTVEGALQISPSARHHRYVVCTGGEPLLQLDKALVDAFHAVGFEVGVETNGTQAAPPGIDWLCVSPKANAALVLDNGDELKLVFPQSEPAAQPERFTQLAFRHFSLQPMDGPALAENTRLAVQYCLRHPRWRLSLQTHKLLGLR